MKKLLLATMSLTALMYTGAALAEEAEWRSWPLGQRLNVGISAFRPELDTKVSLTAGPILGVIDFEQNLGLDDTESVPLAYLRWRFFKRHTFRVDYFKLDRSGAGTAPADITLCPDGNCLPPLPIDWPVNSFVDVEAVNFGYDYSIIFNEKLNWSIGIGLSLQDFQVGILTDDPLGPGTIEVESEFTAPLPTLATTFNYAFTDKWIFDLSFNWLDVDVDLDNSGKFDGRILAFDTGIRWQTWKNVGFLLKYTAFDLEFDVDDGDDFAGFVDYKYRGPRFGVNVYF
jgi:hypothetical protein